MLIRTLVLAGALLLAACITARDPLSQPDAPNLAPYVGGRK